MSEKALTIGYLAKAANVNVETVRYYQRQGLIEEPVKPAQGYRVYPQSTLDRIKFIKRAQTLGFSLQEIAELMSLGNGQCSEVRYKAEQKYTQIGKQIQDLTILQSTLRRLIYACMKDEGSVNCPIVETLASEKAFSGTR